MLSVASGATAAPQLIVMLVGLAAAAFLFAGLTMLFIAIPAPPLDIAPAVGRGRKPSFAARLARAADTLF